MDDAFDTLQNHLVRASNADYSDFPERYLCPKCQTEVVYAAGDWISAHFRHRRGTDHDDCERYCRNFHVDVPMSHHEYEHLDAVLVAKQAETATGVFVTFAVRFRPAYTAKGVTFVSGSASTKYASHPSARQQYFRIERPEENYQVKAHVSHNREVHHIVTGFGSTPALFRASESEAVRIPQHREIKPGSYLACSKTSLETKLHGSLGAKALRTIPGLHVTQFTIPQDPNWEIRRNIQLILGFKTVAQIADFAFISPLNITEFAPDCWEVSREADVTLVIRLSKHLYAYPTRLLVQKRTAGQLSTDYLPTQQDSGPIFLTAKAGTQRPDLYRIALPDPVRFLVQINFTNEITEPQCARIAFQFGLAQNKRLRLNWSSHDLPAALLSASQGKCSLMSLTKPVTLPMTLCDSAGQRVTITNSAPIADVITFLRKGRFPCFLSVPGYPSITIRRPKSRSTVPAPRRSDHFVPTGSRQSARLLNAFSRGRASRYSVSSLLQK